MPGSLTLSQIRSQAIAFSREWREERRESAEKQSFWNEFFEVFGIRRRRVATFEVPVSLRDGRHGSVDLFWRGTLLVEHKSRGADLTAAFRQATGYFDGIPEEDLPRHVVVSDFARFRIYDLENPDAHVEFPLENLHEHVEDFGFLTGYSRRAFESSPPVNERAARLMASLHDDLRRNGYTSRPLAALLVRTMFCLFADHTAIFPRGLFRDLIERCSRPDGSDAGALLSLVFQVLDTPPAERQKNLGADLAELPYVNGGLFAERFDAPAFDEAARRTLLRCAAFDWSEVSPAIFGSMFQHVIDEDRGRRRAIGAHYTSEENILKVLGPALLDGLRTAFEKARGEAALIDLYRRITEMAVLDPACGCGNFLVVAFRELRRLQIRILERLHARRGGGEYFDSRFASGIEVDSMYGIEVEEFPCQVAAAALHLVEHQTNLEASRTFGRSFVRMPLDRAPHILRANALRVDWADHVPLDRLACVVGNPPFVGKQYRTREQAEDMADVFRDAKGSGDLDYSAAWHMKAFRTLEEEGAARAVPVAFVSTNSLVQGEQPGVLWPPILERARIFFAHRTFRWSNDAPGVANVFCVIVGWRIGPPGSEGARLFDHETPDSPARERAVARINAYLVDGPDVALTKRRAPLCDAPRATFGCMPNDDGNLLLDAESRAALLASDPGVARFVRPFLADKEFLHGRERWCLWLEDASPEELEAMPGVMARVRAVRKFRAASARKATRALADTPALFGEIRRPRGTYILVPRVTSEYRRVIPMAFAPPRAIPGDSCIAIHSKDPYVLGVLQSAMHMAWVAATCGRLEGRFRYSNEIVYHNFPWPEDPSEARVAAVRAAIDEVLKTRTRYRGSSLADLYDPPRTPAPLVKAHRALDRAVDRAYRARGFESDLERVRFLFERHAALSRNGHLPLEEGAARRGRARSGSGRAD